jgi:kinesin family protein 4/21/27
MLIIILFFLRLFNDMTNLSDDDDDGGGEQTGSGKTYSMGTGLEADQQLCSMSDNVGILPRSVHHLFTGIEMLREEAIQIGQTPPEFRVQAQFLELYNEEIIDLLEPTTRVIRK